MMGIQLKGKKETGRNEPCACGSGLKSKVCHGSILKQTICNQAANEKMAELIFEEQVKKGLRCKHGVLKTEHCKECKIGG